jgi:pyruvate ferredoxin oxidoreductase alpha subunit
LAADESFSHLTMVNWGGPHDQQWRWRSHQDAMTRAKQVIAEVDEEYEERFGRSYGGLLEEYRCEDADAALVAMGTVASTARAAVDKLRKDGKRVGLVKLRSFRPFPREEFRRIGAHVGALCVLDRSISLGDEGGIVYNSVRSALYGLSEGPTVMGYHLGMAGKEVRARDIEKIAARALEERRGPEPPVRWV